MYIDESGIDQGIYKTRGWGKKGKVLIGKRSGKHYRRVNILSGMRGKEIVAPIVFTGACNTALFLQWVKDHLVKELKPGQVIVMDNASFHKSDKIRQVIESAKCKLIYLPPYSPELNPIEKFWANMKRWIKQNIPLMSNAFKAIIAFFAAQTTM